MGYFGDGFKIRDVKLGVSDGLRVEGLFTSSSLLNSKFSAY